MQPVQSTMHAALTSDLVPARCGPNHLAFVHFGDLHVRQASDENYEDFQNLIAEANHNLAGQVDFAFLPGDNADDGTEDEYQLVEAALKRLSLPVHAIPGDHDKATGTLHLFQRYLAPALYRAVDVLGFRLLFLNAMDGISPQSFDFSEEQMSWLERQLNGARVTGLRPLVFTHLYPSELETQGKRFSRAIRQGGVELVEMGHTHYNELANDGRTIYATTRSTGQAEEGPPGFSMTVIDDNVISWKFKEREQWPLAIITSPAEEKLITRPASPHHVVRGEILVCARVWDARPLRSVVMLAGDLRERPMELIDGIWACRWNSAEVDDGVHRLSIRAETVDRRTAEDAISILISQSGKYREPSRHSTDYENAIGTYPEKCIFGTQLGPNENGTKGPWPSWREPKTAR